MGSRMLGREPNELLAEVCIPYSLPLWRSVNIEAVDPPHFDFANKRLKHLDLNFAIALAVATNISVR